MFLSDIDLSTHLIEDILSSLSDSVCIADGKEPGHPILYANPAFETMTGFTNEEACGQDYLFLNNIDSEEVELEAINSAMVSGDSCQVVLRNKRKSGELFWNETTLSSIKGSDGNALYFISIQKDISDEIQLQKTINDQIKALESAKVRLEGLARTDSLTGLYNKHYFDLQFPTQFNIAKRNYDSISVFMVDVDHFKRYNDHYGHLAGDKCLKQIANALKEVFKRTSDFVARFGGEEFIIYSIGSSEQQAINSAKKLVEYMKDLKIPHEKGDISYVTASIGIASSDWENPLLHKELVEMADQALYMAKKNGRNRAVVF